ncbi:MAG TPA: hypothetical protein VNZ58_02230 [Thermomicrobiales bacterium]|nr:hypothetical protein [Thermomicrobiales bacterium]
MSSVEQVEAELDAQIAALTDEEIDGIYAGAPERFQDIGDETIPVEQPEGGVEPELLEPPSGKVLLRNINYPNEVIYLTQDGEFTGESVNFIEGSLIVSEDIADQVTAACPWAKREPQTGQVLEFEHTGFKTRVPSIYQQHVAAYYDNL